MNDNALVTITQSITSPGMQEQLGKMLPANVPLDRFTEITLMAIRKTPEVLEADRQTLYDACLSLARRGLLPDKKEAALVVFPTNVGTREKPKWIKVVTEMAMVGGIIIEMAKAGVRAYANSVYANDAIRVWNDDEGQHVLHEPVVFGERGARVGCFAAGKMADGRTYVEAMNMDDIAKVRARSKQKDKDGNPTGTWRSDPERMEQKSALHRLRKRIPILDDAEALQNLKDMEEESDIDLTPQSGDDIVPPAEQSALRPPETESPVKRQSRPRALQSVVDQTNKNSSQELADITNRNHNRPPPEAELVKGNKTEPEPAEEYQGDDII